MLDAQQHALMHVGGRSSSRRASAVRSADDARQRRGIDGRRISRGRSRGSTGARSRRRTRKSRELHEDFGRSLGALAPRSRLRRPGAPSRLLLGSRERPRDRRRAFARSQDADLGRTIDTDGCVRRARGAAARSLPRSAIHGDLNDHNVLVGGGDVEIARPARDRVVDFGDMVHSYRVGDLAIAIAYAHPRRGRSARPGGSMVRGYREHEPTNDELAALFGLISTPVHQRLHRRRPARAAPRQQYLGVSQQAIARRSRCSQPFRLRSRRRCCARRRGEHLAKGRSRRRFLEGRQTFPPLLASIRGASRHRARSERCKPFTKPRPPSADAKSGSAAGIGVTAALLPTPALVVIE